MTDNPFDRFGQNTGHIFNLYNAWAKQKNISYSTLAVLHTLSREHSCTQKHIATLWALPKQTVSATCRNLHSDGLIGFVRGGNDKREKMLVLTEQGKNFAGPLIAELDGLELKAVGRFGRERAGLLVSELAEFGRILANTMATKR